MGSFDVKSAMLKSLDENTALKNLCTGGFHNRKAKDIKVFPRIVYMELLNADDSYADDQAVSSTIKFQISIFTNGATVTKETSIAKEVDKTMKSLGFSRYFSTDLYEEDEDVYHKVMRYRKSESA